VLQPGTDNTSAVASMASSTSGNNAANSYGSYDASAWTGNIGTGYNAGGYDVNAMYNTYAQMYGQYYGNQVMSMTCH